MNAKFYTSNTPFDKPADQPEQWREVIPENHWRTGYSAKALAHCWTDAGGFPQEVQSALNQSGFPALENLQFERGCPEYKVPLPGGNKPSTNDIFVWADGNDGVVCISVEGKVREDFGQSVKTWGWGTMIGTPEYLGGGKGERLEYLQVKTGLRFEEVLNIRYQLLHRTASAIIEAEKNSKCKTAMMLVHSFSQTHEKFHDFAAFAKVMGANVKSGVAEDCILRADPIGNINLYLGWITGEEKYLHK